MAFSSNARLKLLAMVGTYRDMGARSAMQNVNPLVRERCRGARSCVSHQRTHQAVTGNDRLMKRALKADCPPSFVHNITHYHHVHW